MGLTVLIIFITALIGVITFIFPNIDEDFAKPKLKRIKIGGWILISLTIILGILNVIKEIDNGEEQKQKDSEIEVLKNNLDSIKNDNSILQSKLDSNRLELKLTELKLSAEIDNLIVQNSKSERKRIKEANETKGKIDSLSSIKKITEKPFFVSNKPKGKLTQNDELKVNISSLNTGERTALEYDIEFEFFYVQKNRILSKRTGKTGYNGNISVPANKKYDSTFVLDNLSNQNDLILVIKVKHLYYDEILKSSLSNIECFEFSFKNNIVLSDYASKEREKLITKYNKKLSLAQSPIGISGK